MSDAAAASTSKRRASSLRTLLHRVVDYAGLFPPASLNMRSAVAEYAEHRAGPDAWALGRFVLPAARLEEFDGAGSELLPRDGAHSWALSALVGSDLEEDVERIQRFNTRHGDVRAGAVLVDTVELKAHATRDVTRAAELLDRRFDTYMEIPVAEDPAGLIATIAEKRGKAKIRTGGVAPDAFPTTAQVARFIMRCTAHAVAFKATAGLHHALRAEYRLTYAPDAPAGTMFGFLNVLLATAALHAGLSREECSAILEERDASALEFEGDAVGWRGRSLPADALERARDSMQSFGSCSFREPVDELRAMGLL